MNNRIVVSMMLVAALATSCDNKQPVETNTVPDISVAYPLNDTITLYATYPGYLEASKSVELVARVSGYQISSQYIPGEKVRKGDTLFVIEPTQYQDAVAQAEAALATARSQYYYAENNYHRMKDVAQSNAISEIDLIKAESAYHQAEAAVKNAEAALQTANTRLDYCYVRAPFSGRVTASEYGDGAFVNAGGSSALLAKLYQDDEMFAYFNIDDVQYMKLVQNKQNNKARVARNTIKLLFNEPLPHDYEGYIDYMAPNIELSTGTMRMRVVVKNPYGELKDGLYTNIRLPYSHGDKSILVRDASIGSDQVGKYLYIVNDSNRVELRHIELGEIYDDTMRVVTKGLSPDDRYITRAMQKVREGMRINPVVENTVSE